MRLVLSQNRAPVRDRAGQHGVYFIGERSRTLRGQLDSGVIRMYAPENIAIEFLEQYKAVMRLLNRNVEPSGVKEFVALRPLIYERLSEIEAEFFDSIPEPLIAGLRRAEFGSYVYLKKYKNGYALHSLSNSKYFLCKALTSPLEEFLEPYSVIKTVILPYKGYLLCDGLIVKRGVILGRNMTKEVHQGYLAAKKNGSLIVGA